MLPSRSTPSPRRAAAPAVLLVLGGLLALAVAALLGGRAHGLLTTTAPWRPDAVVATLVVAAGAVAAVWVGASAVVAGLCALVRSGGRTWRTGEAAVRRWAPGLVRRALALAVVAAVGAGATTAAHASEPAPPVAEVLDLGWAPTSEVPSPADAVTTDLPPGPAQRPPTPEAPAPRPSDTPTTVSAGSAPERTAPVPAVAAPAPDGEGPQDAHGGSGAPAADAGRRHGAAGAATTPDPAPSGETGAPAHAVATPTVVVRPGDTLWAVAARHLGPGAPDSAVAAAWPTWYAANAATIGPDPDLIRPGQVLVVPADLDGSTR